MPEGLLVASVAAGSAAARAGISAGDRILSVSGEAVRDLLDLHYLTSRTRFRLRWRGTRGILREALFRSGGKPLGIHPEPIRVARCRNRCIFCFVHQLPKGLRKSLYVKDEDVRLSFLDGQYVTFSDVTEEEIRKILRYRLSPLYISIHTTDDALRRKILRNPAACGVTDVMRRLVSGGIAIHGQIVVCPGINDGDELRRTLRSLLPLRPGLSTVAVVPVGLTAHRRGLPPLRPVGPAEARETLAILDDIGRVADARNLKGGEREPFAVPSDEFLLLGGRRIPGRAAYGSFAQLENGVGILRRFMDDASLLFRSRNLQAGGRGGAVVTGMLPRKHIADFLREYSRRSGARFELLPVENRLMGKSVTVTGLLSGRDLLAALRGRRVKRIFLPSVLLRDAGDLFLDDLSPGDIARETRAEITVFEPTPRGFHSAVHTRETPI
jgi:putative radical SAM enzyme (TIGR03279 family)